MRVEFNYPRDPKITPPRRFMDRFLHHRPVTAGTMQNLRILLLLFLFYLPAKSNAQRGARGTIEDFPPTTKYFNQTIDHFSYYTGDSDQSLTFQQKYLIYDKFWKKKYWSNIVLFWQRGRY